MSTAGSPVEGVAFVRSDGTMQPLAPLYCRTSWDRASAEGFGLMLVYNQNLTEPSSESGESYCPLGKMHTGTSYLAAA